MATLVLTVIGDDRSGLVNALAGAIADHGGNWEQSHMSHLAGKFAGIVLVEVPDSRADALVAALDAIDEEGLLEITRSVVADELQDAPAAAATVEIVGQDRPGIVHDISSEFAARGVSIAQLETSTTSAPMGGGMLFEAVVRLQVPAAVSLDELRQSLEALANELMVDIDFSQGPAAG